MDWSKITAIATSVQALGIFVVVFQIRADHERARREKAADLILEWTKNLLQESSAARRLSEALDEVQNRKLHESKDVEIPIEHHELTTTCLVKHKDLVPTLIVGGKTFVLKAPAASVVRWHLITYLNLLESVLSAERHKIADSAMIREQIQYLVDQKQGHNGLEKFRTAAGGDAAYPSIGRMVRSLREGGLAKEGKRRIA